MKKKKLVSPALEGGGGYDKDQLEGTALREEDHSCRHGCHAAGAQGSLTISGCGSLKLGFWLEVVLDFWSLWALGT